LEVELIPQKIKVALKLMYANRTGRAVWPRRMLRTMTFSKGVRYNDPASRQYILPFIKFFNLDMNEVADPIESFSNFNEFFYRKLKPEALAARIYAAVRIAIIR
jgi:phosphatidylserine decarboxylase